MDAPGEQKPTNCEICQLPVNPKKNLYIKHLWVHHSKVKTLCTFCGAKFKSLSQLNEHLLVEHEAHSCKACGITFFVEDEHTIKEAITNGTVKVSDGTPSEVSAAKLVAELSENKLFKQHQEKCPAKYIMKCQMPECYSQEEMDIKDLIKHLIKGHKLGDDYDGLLTAADVSYQLAYRNSKSKPFRRWIVTECPSERTLWADLQRAQMFAYMRYNEYSCVTAPAKVFFDEEFDSKTGHVFGKRKDSESSHQKPKKGEPYYESNDRNEGKSKSGGKCVPNTTASLKDPLEEVDAIKVRMSQELQLFYTERTTAPDPIVTTKPNHNDYEDVRQLTFQINRNNYRRFGDNKSMCFSNAHSQMLKITPEEEVQVLSSLGPADSREAKLAEFVESKFNRKQPYSEHNNDDSLTESMMSSLLPKSVMYPNHFPESSSNKKNKPQNPYPNSTNGQPNQLRLSKCLQFPEYLDFGYRYLKCFCCKEILSFTSISEYLEHVFTHAEGKESQECILCDRRFLHPEAFRLHLTTIHSYT